jgi:hypothetical protein
MCEGADSMPSLASILAGRQEHLLSFPVYEQNGYTLSAAKGALYAQVVQLVHAGRMVCERRILSRKLYEMSLALLLH